MDGCPSDRIEHVVVLMLENRSFDHLLGDLPIGPDGSPLTPSASNPSPCGSDVESFAAPSHLSGVDPPHSFELVEMQIGSSDGAAMNGFVQAYFCKAAGEEPKAIFHWLRTLIAGIVLIAALIVPGALLREWLRHDSNALGAAAAVTIAMGAVGQWPDPVLGPRLRRRSRQIAAGAAVVIVVLAAIASVSWRFPLVPAVTAGVLFGALSVATYGVKRKLESDAPLTADPCEAARMAMARFQKDQMRVLPVLAREFALCTRWFSSVPGETWPNRNFVHAGTSDGHVAIEIGFYKSRTVFDLLDQRYPNDIDGRNWRIYFDGGVPQVAAFRELWRGDRAGNWHLFRDAQEGFVQAVSGDDLPRYTFIEPKHFGIGTNSHHPGNNTLEKGRLNGCGPVVDWDCSDFGRGEQLVAEIYEALRSKPAVFDKTLFIITYDEHGGFHDSVPPVGVDAPRRWSLSLTQRLRQWFVERAGGDFDFTTSGVRVPAIVVSPWVKQGTLDETQFDHASVIATIRDVFDLPARTEYERAAQPVSHLVCELDRPRGPDSLPSLSRHVSADATFAVEEVFVPEPVDGFPAELMDLAREIERELAEAGVKMSILDDDPRLIGDPQQRAVLLLASHAIQARHLKPRR